MIAALDERLILACRRHPLAAEVARGLTRSGVPEGARVMVAASGGADSTALMALCAGLAAHGRIELVVGTVDHGIRSESALDCQCVAMLGARLGVRVLTRRLDLSAGSGLADRARTARYEALASMALECGATSVLAAHHADDQLETMLIALARGAGLGGMGGMPGRRPIPCETPGAQHLLLVRPCLRMSRESLRAACVDLAVQWREDPTNDRRDTPRGIVRHVVIPALESVATGATRRAARTGELARLGNVLLESHVSAMRGPDGSIARSAFRNAPEALAATAVWMLADDRMDDATRWAAAEAIVDDSTEPRRFPMSGGNELSVCAHSVRVRPVTV